MATQCAYWSVWCMEGGGRMYEPLALAALSDRVYRRCPVKSSKIEHGDNLNLHEKIAWKKGKSPFTSRIEDGSSKLKNMPNFQHNVSQPCFSRRLLNAHSPLKAALFMLFISINDSTVCNAVPTRKSSGLLINAAEVFSTFGYQMWKILGAENILSWV